MYFNRVNRVLTAAFVALSASPVLAQTVNATDRGFYNDGGLHIASNLSYLTGYGGDITYRSWFLFAVPTPGIGQQFINATLRILVNFYNSRDSSETYQVTDFTGSLSDLVAENGNGNGVAIYNDLGPGGAVYGSHVISSADRGTFVEIPLSSAALSDINAAAGSSFALGGYLSTLNFLANNENVFGVSDSLPLSSTQLILVQSVASPEPGSLALALLGVAGAGSGLLARRNGFFARRKR